MNGALVQAATVTAVSVPWTAVAAILLALIVNTGAVFYWGGKTAQMLKDHERRLGNLEGVRNVPQ